MTHTCDPTNIDSNNGYRPTTIDNTQHHAQQRTHSLISGDLTRETLLGDPDLVLPLAKHIDSTGRFKQTLVYHE